MRGRGHPRPGQGCGLSATAVHGIHTTLHAALDKAVEENLIFRNPSDGCKLPSTKSREMKVLTPEEIQEADVVILAIDVKISGENRFKGKPVVRMSTEKAMKNTGAMLQSIEEALTKKKNGGN